MSFIDSRYAAQIPIAEAVQYLLGDTRKYTNRNEYRDRYWRKATQSEVRAHYNMPAGVIIVHVMMVEREDAPEAANKPFQRFSVVPEMWRDAARDSMIEKEFKDVI